MLCPAVSRVLTRYLPALLLAGCVTVASASDPRPATDAAAAADPGALDPETAALLERERIRTTILTAFDTANAPTQSRAAGMDAFNNALDGVLDLGPGAVSYLIPEVQSPSPDTFFFSVVALGHLGGPEAERALREAVELADREPGRFPEIRKMWGSYALALMGHADAVDLLEQGNKKLGRHEMLSHASALDVTAALAAPDSVPRLIARLDRVLEQAEDEALAGALLEALRRTGDPRARTRCLTLLDHPSWRVRRQCAEALRAAGEPEDVPRMLPLLDDAERRVRSAAAFYLEDVKSPKSVERLLAQLETEQAHDIRGAIYRALAALMGEGALPVFRNAMRQPNYMDRFYLVDATARIDSPRSLNLLREFLRDPDLTVQKQALLALADRPGAGPRDNLLIALRSTDWPVVRTAIEQLLRLRERRAAPRIADLLVNNALPNYAPSGLARVRLSTMLDALIDFGYTEVTDDLRRRIGRLNDVDADMMLERAVRDLDTIRERGEDHQRWVALLGDADPDRRRLAIRTLRRLGDHRAIDALIGAFDGAGRDDRLLILEVLAAAPDPRAGALAEKLLLDPAYDAAVEGPVRAAGAWLARRIGGPAMTDALRRSVGRREGWDYSVLVYYGVLAGRDAVPTLQTALRERTRRLAWKLMWENNEVIWMIGQLSHGRPIDRLDVPPERHSFPE